LTFDIRHHDLLRRPRPLSHTNTVAPTDVGHGTALANAENLVATSEMTGPSETARASTAKRAAGHRRHLAVVGRHRPSNDPNLSRSADLSQQVARTLPDFAHQHAVPILRDPHRVILDVAHHVRAMAVLRRVSPSRPESEAEVLRLKGGAIKPDTWALTKRLKSNGRAMF
jgi:hypothetical protein